MEVTRNNKLIIKHKAVNNFDFWFTRKHRYIIQLYPNSETCMGIGSERFLHDLVEALSLDRSNLKLNRGRRARAIRPL